MAFDLQEVLDECKKSALEGYSIASTQYKNLHETIQNAENQIESTLFAFNTSTCYLSDATTSLSQQLRETESALDGLSFAFRDDLQSLKENLGKFSITLFGRTMAGKSTLMEVLTHGDGSSIGRGSQRTTQDVRSYYWNDLEITDVPGISAFEGEEDESIAFEAAKAADLILFLITDDAPQASEAECFGQILNMGKPVVCIMNVKAAVSEGKSIKLALRDIEKKFDFARLNAIRDQFYSYAEKMGQSWKNIPFVYVHLQSAFIAQHTLDKVAQESYQRASRIDLLKNVIIQQVINKGKFYRIKTFVDIISNPMLSSMENLLQQSLINSAQGRTILAKKRKLEAWKKNFQGTSATRIKSCIAHLRSELNAEIASFAENHFSDNHADKAWQQLLRDRRVQDRCQDLLNKLEEQCNESICELSREITNELNYSSSSIVRNSIRGSHIIDGKRIWNWSATIVGSGLTIGSIVAGLFGAAIAGPLGWAAAGVGLIGFIGSFFFSSRDKQEYEARVRLEKTLRNSVSALCDSLEKQLHKNVASLVRERNDSVLQELTRIDSVLFRLADTQKDLAWALDDHLLELNTCLVKEAIRIIGAEGLEYHIQSVARIPGAAMTFILNDKTVFPEEQRQRLTTLTGEYIGFAFNSPYKRVLISRIIGKAVDRGKIGLEEKICVAHIPLNELSPQVMNRVRMAQQLSRIAITK